MLHGLQSQDHITLNRNLDCVRGSLNLAEGCIHAGVKKFVGIGTCAEYDISSDPIPFNGALKADTLYAASKLATYHLLENIFNKHNISFSWCRLFYLFGEGEDQRRLVLNKLSMVKAELSSGEQIRDFIDVSLVGRIISDIALSNKDGVINVCSGKPKQCANMLLKLLENLTERIY